MASKTALLKAYRFRHLMLCGLLVCLVSVADAQAPLLPSRMPEGHQARNLPNSETPQNGSQAELTAGQRKTGSEIINDVPSTPQGLNIYVNDYAHLLASADAALLRERLQALDEAGLAQMSVLILPDTDRELAEFAPMIMNRWGIQHHGKKNGLLILVNARRVRENLSGNRIFVGTGLALEGMLPDALVGRVLDEQAIPAFQAGEPSRGITNTALTLVKILAGDRKLQARYSQPEGPSISDWIWVIILLFFFFPIFRRRRGGFLGGGYYGGGDGWIGGGSGWRGGGGGFGGGGDSSGGGGAGR